MEKSKDFFCSLNGPQFIARCMWELATNEDYSCGQFEVDTAFWLRVHGVQDKKLWKKLDTEEFDYFKSLAFCIEAIMNMPKAKAGQARWKKLTKEQRSEIAKKAVGVRLKKNCVDTK